MRSIVLISMLLSLLMGNGYSNYGHKSDVKFDSSLIHSYIRQLNQLTSYQKYWLKRVYKKCEHYNLQNTCAAIAWEESQFGVYKVITDTGDYGIMGINLKWFIIDNGYRNNRYSRAKLATVLTCNDDYNIMYAVAKLEKLKSRYSSWKKTWAHYNGGSRPNWRYAKRILNKVIAIRRWYHQQ